jgi:hypothetical protein
MLYPSILKSAKEVIEVREYQILLANIKRMKSMLFCL